MLKHAFGNVAAGTNVMIPAVPGKSVFVSALLMTTPSTTGVNVTLQDTAGTTISQTITLTKDTTLYGVASPTLWQTVAGEGLQMLNDADLGYDVWYNQ